MVLYVHGEEVPLEARRPRVLSSRPGNRKRSKFADSISSLWLFLIGLGLAMTYFLHDPSITVWIFLFLAAASLGIVIWSNREVPDWNFGDRIITGVAVCSPVSWLIPLRLYGQTLAMNTAICIWPIRCCAGASTIRLHLLPASLTFSG